MSQKKRAGEQQAQRQQMTGAERLAIRISSMINHPIAQTQRWVTIHQLDSDAQGDWNEMLEVLSGTDGIDMTLNDDDTVTLRWAPQELDGGQLGEEGWVEAEEAEEEEAPF